VVASAWAPVAAVLAPAVVESVPAAAALALAPEAVGSAPAEEARAPVWADSQREADYCYLRHHHRMQ
jgi:hypothetical protein